MLHVVFYMDSIEECNKRYEMERITKEQTEFVHLAKDKFIVKEAHHKMCALGDIQQVHKSNDRQEQEICTLELSPEKWYEKRAEDKYYRRWYRTNHNSLRPFAGEVAEYVLQVSRS